MRITAQFYSTDDAEFAASALRREADGIFDVTVREKGGRQAHREDIAPMGFFTSINAGTASSVPMAVNGLSPENSPLPVYGMGDDAVTVFPSNTVPAELDVICRQSAAKKVSGMLINRGGHNLRVN